MVRRKNAQDEVQSSPSVPVSGTPRDRIDDVRVPFGTCPRQSIDMNTASPLGWSNLSAKRLPENSFHSIFQHAPVAAGRCDCDGIIVEMNTALEQDLGSDLLSQRPLRLFDLVPDAERSTTEELFRDLISGARDSIRVEGTSATHASAVTSWTAWRQPGSVDESIQVFLIGQSDPESGLPHESLLQTQRWEAVGRLAGGVVHDFNNLLTGVMLYCDLLLSSLDPIDRRRRYADEIRSAILQATGLVQQLLGFARSKSERIRPMLF
jgi:two-component system, cell cycle sensor histidine kinase and response regulator CckA